MPLPTAPVVLLHQGYKRRGDLQPVGIARKADGVRPPGLMVTYEDLPQQAVRDGAAGAPPLTPIIADPGAHKFGRATIGGPKSPAASWIGRAAPANSTEWDRTIREALAEQRGQPVDALIVPGIELDATAPNELQEQVDAIRRATRNERQADDPPWFARFCVQDEWLRRDPLRRACLNQVTDLPDDLGVALHVRWAKSGAARDQARLEALKRVVVALANDGRRVLLIQAGMVGWLSIAWGAWGFSVGLSQQGWMDTERQVFKRQKGVPSAPARQLYFEREFIHHIPAPDLRRLSARQNYTGCPCRFCQKIPPDPDWDQAAANQHGLYALADLTQRVTGNSRAARRVRVRAEIQNADRAWNALRQGAGLSSDARPAHLTIWDQLA